MPCGSTRAARRSCLTKGAARVRGQAGSRRSHCQGAAGGGTTEGWGSVRPRRTGGDERGSGLDEAGVRRDDALVVLRLEAARAPELAVSRHAALQQVGAEAAVHYCHEWAWTARRQWAAWWLARVRACAGGAPAPPGGTQGESSGRHAAERSKKPSGPPSPPRAPAGCLDRSTAAFNADRLLHRNTLHTFQRRKHRCLQGIDAHSPRPRVCEVRVPETEATTKGEHAM